MLRFDRIFVVLSVLCYSINSEILQDEVYAKIQKKVSDSLRETLENLKKQMPCGFPDSGIPPLAPFLDEYRNFEYADETVQLAAEYSDLNVTGLNMFDINNVDFSILSRKLDFDINFNAILLNGEYTIDANILDKQAGLNGKGHVDFGVYNLRLAGNVVFGVKLSGVHLKEFNLQITLGDIHSNITGLTESEIANDFLNEFIELAVKDILEEEQETVVETIRELIVPIANEYLGEYSLWDIIKMITSPSKPGKECKPEENNKHFL